MPPRLGIHVLGPRFGESIVLELPDGGIGVIDSFAPRQGRHPVAEYLAKQFPALKTLRFFAITHPHADHCFRCAELFDRFRPQETWIFLPFPAGQVQEYYKALTTHGTADAVEAAIDLPAGSVALSLLQLRDRVMEPIKRKMLPYRPFASPRSFQLCGGQLHIHFLTPGDRMRIVYADQVEKAAQAIFTDGAALLAAGKLPRPDHNLASGGVLIEYGATRALLMADAEDLLWEEWLEIKPPAELVKPVHFLKAAHHGSDNGYHKALYTAITDPKTTVAVITPFNQGNKHLPTAKGVQALRPHVRDLFCTNRNEAATTTGLTWHDPNRSTPLPRIPSRWAAMIQNRRDLGRLLVPAPGRPGMSGKTPSLPTEWAVDAQQNPALWRLLRPEFRRSTAAAPTEDYAVAAYYDQRGNLTELRTGQEVGRLP